MTAGTPDHADWAADVDASLSPLNIPPNLANICAALAVTAQESGVRARPTVPGLGRIARDGIHRRAPGPGCARRSDESSTDRELSLFIEDFVDRVPLDQCLLTGWSPVCTGGPVQVGIAFAGQHVRQKRYPCPMTGSDRDEVLPRCVLGGGLACRGGISPAASDAPAA